MFNLMHIGCHR